MSFARFGFAAPGKPVKVAGVAKPPEIELRTGERIAILYEDRSVIALDKPRGWILAPASWQRTARNLQLALVSSMRAGDYWARSRRLKFVRFIHRLDAETSGILLLARSPGALSAMGTLFESGAMKKTYWAVVSGVPQQEEWRCELQLAADPAQRGKMKADTRRGKPAETIFRVLEVRGDRALIAARPLTGRTHQIRVHLAAAGHPVLGDQLYGTGGESRGRREEGLALRAISLRYQDPFTRREVAIEAPADEFLREYGFEPRHGAQRI